MRIRNTQHALVEGRIRLFTVDANRLNATAAESVRAQRERVRAGLARRYRVRTGS